MRKILMIALGVSLIAASSVQMAAAAERHHHARKVVRTPTSQQWEQFRGARNSADWPAGNSLTRLYNEGNS
jgi:predicted phage tail protein